MFDEDEFDAREWVNAVFRETPPANVSREQGNAELDTVCDQLIKDLPSVMRSIDVVSQEVDSLRESMAIVRNDIEAVEKNTAESMSLLMQLDSVKSRLTATVDTLEQARQWEEASTSISAAQHSSDIRVVHDALVKLQQFMRALSVDDGHAEERSSLQTELRNRLESLAHRDLTTAVQAHNAAAARDLLQHFAAMERTHVALDLYKSTAQAALTRVELSPDRAAPLPDALRQYFEAVAAVLQEEEKFCARVFEPSGHHPLADVTAVFYPTMAATIRSALKSSLPQAPNLLGTVAVCIEEAEKGLLLLPTPTQAAVRTILGAFVPYQVNFAEHLYHHMKAKVEALGSVPPAPATPMLRGGADDDHQTEEEDSDMQQLAAYARELAGSWHAHCRCISSLMADDVPDMCARITGCGAADGAVSALARVCKHMCATFVSRISQLKKLALNTRVSELPWPLAEPLFAAVAHLGAFISALAQRETALRRLVLEHRGAQVAGEEDSLAFMEESDDPAHDWEKRRATDGHPSLLHDYLRDETTAQRDAAVFVRSCLKGRPLFDAARQEVSKLNDCLHACLLDLLLHTTADALTPVPTLNAWTSTQHEVQTLPFVNKIAGDLETLAENIQTLDQKEDIVTAANSCTIAPFTAVDTTENDADAEDRDEQADDNDDADAIWLRWVTRRATHEVAETVYRIKALSEPGRAILCDNISILCNAVLEIGDVDDGLTKLNEMLRTSQDEVLSEMKTLAETPLAAATYHAARLRGLVDATTTLAGVHPK
ncbi:hypothetical protein PTSG_06874 [Salpingoeca rosetta]|uniref:Conserved oligomeric Golgi complex subunit 7 n=1 Tax=Salpingoeca rosetta (strain ATCC 50818 / BSB-021) TaxID=946362 RepID=F2UF20_SALR5|nr:uncharacterized protein PTSG_06874 [Salpingoeca rosetta]EGD75220.1 hypothetical protein PTSG_06874 [Salpingoeca rosetta]|eukprot:XP_004992273.1 hypothetical protein PTSG_06874 [Salpingoeca rosetta]